MPLKVSHYNVDSVVEDKVQRIVMRLKALWKAKISEKGKRKATGE